MSHCEPHPTGFHVEHFDTELVEQVIAVEMEKAVRYAGIHANDEELLSWSEAVLGHVKESVFRCDAEHVLLPELIDTWIHEEIVRLVEKRRIPPASQGMPVMDPLHGMSHVYGRMAVLCRAFFEKRLE